MNQARDSRASVPAVGGRFPRSESLNVAFRGATLQAETALIENKSARKILLQAHLRKLSCAGMSSRVRGVGAFVSFRGERERQHVKFITFSV